MSSATILYDGDCGFCRWSVARILAWDRNRRLRAVPLQDPEADRLLRHLDRELRMESWHLVSAGRVHSAGAALDPLFRLLPGGRPLAILCRLFPRSAAGIYRAVARNRGRLGRWTGSHPDP